MARSHNVKNIFTLLCKLRKPIIPNLSTCRNTALLHGRGISTAITFKCLAGGATFMWKIGGYWKTAGVKWGPVGVTWAFLGFLFKKEDEQLTEDEQVRRLVSKGIVAKQNGDTAGAGHAFHDALNLSTDFLNAKKISKTSHLNHRVFIYDQIANMAMELQDYNAAEEVFKQTMQLAFQLGMKENDNAMIEMTLKLAMIYSYTGRERLACMGFKHCIDEQEKKLINKETVQYGSTELSAEQVKEIEQNTKVLLGKTYKNFAFVYLQKRDFKGAKPLIVKSLNLSREVLGDTNDNTFAILNDLATCEIMMQEYASAEKTLKDAIQRSQKVGSLIEAALCSNLGALYIRTKRLNEAEQFCEQGLKIAEKVNDPYFINPCKACLAKLKELKGSREQTK